MIKILFYIDDLSCGGAEKVLTTLVNNMDKDDFDITVETKFPIDNAHFLLPHIHKKSLFKKNSRLNNLLFSIETQLGIICKRRIKDKYDIECAYLECGPTKVISKSKNKNSVKIAWVHCNLSVAKDKGFIRKTKKWYEKFDNIVCVSEEVKNSFIDCFGNTKNIDVIHNVVDSNRIISLSNEQLDVDKPKNCITLLAVGRLENQKNYKRLLSAHKRIIENEIMTNLWIVGDGSKREEIEEYIKKNNLSSSVKLFGYQSNPYKYMKSADILVCSSDYEGYSTFITEGLILGKPIVTTDCSGMHELLGESEYGIITENSDEGFYQELKKFLLNSDENVKSFSEKANKRGKCFLISALLKENENYFINCYNKGKS